MKLAVWPLATVWLEEPEGASEKSKPIPARGTKAPAVRALLETVRLPVCAPAFAGAKATAAVQVACGASEAGQSVAVNWKPGETASARLFKPSVRLGLVRVTAMGLLTRPTAVWGKLMRMGAIWTEPGTPANPARGTTAGTAREELTARTPVAMPLWEGAKTMSVAQLAPGERLAPQVVWTRLKGAVAERVSEVAAMLPVLVTVTVSGRLVCPGATVGKAS